MKISYHHIPYAKAKKLLHKNIEIIDIYGDNTQEKNVEHVFPQHSFKNNENKTMMRSDLHNLYLCNSKLNNYRKNFKYVDSYDAKDMKHIKILDVKGNVVSNSSDIFSKIGYLMIANNKENVFIPSPYSRGKISRALSYFAVKYDCIEELKELIDIRTLLEWNYKDPVDNEEYLRNILIHKYQNNYNPFIINPDLMIYCFSDMVTIDDQLLKKKRESIIDPLYHINYLMKQIQDLEDVQHKNDKIITSMIKKYKR
jgi:endonuclease I